MNILVWLSSLMCRYDRWRIMNFGTNVDRWAWNEYLGKGRPGFEPIPVEPKK